jgi:hypothetical protein
MALISAESPSYFDNSGSRWHCRSSPLLAP